MAKVTISRVEYTGGNARVFLSNGDELDRMSRVICDVDVSGLARVAIKALIATPADKAP